MRATATSAKDLDTLLVVYFDVLHSEGGNPTAGSRALAALLHWWPSLGCGISSTFPGASRALRGWQKLQPTGTRQPLPYLVAERGRWLSLLSVRRYRKANHALAELAKLDNDVIRVAESARSDLPSMFHNPSAAAAALARAHP